MSGSSVRPIIIRGNWRRGTCMQITISRRRAKVVLIMSTGHIIKFPPLMHNLPFYRAIWLKVFGTSPTSAKLKISTLHELCATAAELELIKGIHTTLLPSGEFAFAAFQDSLVHKCLATWFAKCSKSYLQRIFVCFISSAAIR